MSFAVPPPPTTIGLELDKPCALTDTTAGLCLHLSLEALAIVQTNYPGCNPVLLDLGFLQTISNDALRRCDLTSAPGGKNQTHTVVAVAVGDSDTLAGWVVFDAAYDPAPEWRWLPAYLQGLASLYDVAGLSHVEVGYRHLGGGVNAHLPPASPAQIPITNVLKHLGVPCGAVAVSLVGDGEFNLPSSFPGSPADLLRAVAAVRANVLRTMETLDAGPIAAEHMRRLRALLPEGAATALAPEARCAVALLTSDMQWYLRFGDHSAPWVVRYATREPVCQLCVMYAIVRA